MVKRPHFWTLPKKESSSPEGSLWGTASQDPTPLCPNLHLPPPPPAPPPPPPPPPPSPPRCRLPRNQGEQAGVRVGAEQPRPSASSPGEFKNLVAFF